MREPLADLRGELGVCLRLRASASARCGGARRVLALGPRRRRRPRACRARPRCRRRAPPPPARRAAPPPRSAPGSPAGGGREQPGEVVAQVGRLRAEPRAPRGRPRSLRGVRPARSSSRARSAAISALPGSSRSASSSCASRLFQPLLARERPPQVRVHQGRAGLEGERALEARDRLRRLPERELSRGEAAEPVRLVAARPRAPSRTPRELRPRGPARASRFPAGRARWRRPGRSAAPPAGAPRRGSRSRCSSRTSPRLMCAT